MSEKDKNNAAAIGFEALLRHEVCYRSGGTGSGGSRAMLGAGFILKPGLRVDAWKSMVTEYVLVYVLRGRGLYRDEREREFPLEPGWVFQRFPQQRHTVLIEPDSDWAECFLVCDRTTQEACLRFGLPDRQKPVFRPGLQRHLIERIDRLVRNLRAAADTELPLYLGEFLELLAEFYRVSRVPAGLDSPEQLVANACQLLGQNLNHREPVPELLRGLGSGYERLRKLFLLHTGSSPAAYRLRCRMDAARALLADRGLTIKEVAYRLGYPNPYAFSTQFKTATGLSPRQFRAGSGGR